MRGDREGMAGKTAQRIEPPRQTSQGSSRGRQEGASHPQQHREFGRRTLKPARLENVRIMVSDFYRKDPTDPQWKDDQGYKDWVAFMDKYYPEGDKTVGPCFAQTFVQVLKQCGDGLARENIMKEAANLHDFRVPMLFPGITINTSPTDFAPIKQIQMGRFDGERWRLFGSLITGKVGT
jgi:branched-chain amino acid transport system substrate-binding protein